jgi:hypothetical protein
MSRIKALVLCAVAVCALSVALTAGASAAEFHASKVGGTLKGTQLNTQKFKVTGGTVECTKAATSGKTAALLAATQLVTVVYTGCSAFGLGATVTPAQYILNANGTSVVENNITITVAAASCSITVSPSGNGTLKTVVYKNSAGKIIEESAVTAITYTSTGGTCGASGNNGTYTGNNDVELEGGTLGWA